MAKILYADDEEQIRNVVTAFLKNEGHDVASFETGDLLYSYFEKNDCDLVILDIMMPGTDGIGILQKIRQTSNVPVMLLTAKDTDIDFYNGLAMGGDDYLTKPFKPMILSAKINALLRRIRYEKSGKETSEKKDLTCGNVTFLTAGHEVRVKGTVLPLTPTELKLLIFLMEHFDEAVSKDDLLEKIWGFGSEIESRVVDETNRRLRKKLAAAGADIYVQTVWGYGYKLTGIPGSN